MNKKKPHSHVRLILLVDMYIWLLDSPSASLIFFSRDIYYVINDMIRAWSSPLGPRSNFQPYT